MHKKNIKILIATLTLSLSTFSLFNVSAMKSKTQKNISHSYGKNKKPKNIKNDYNNVQIYKIIEKYKDELSKSFKDRNFNLCKKLICLDKNDEIDETKFIENLKILKLIDRQCTSIQLENHIKKDLTNYIKEIKTYLKEELKQIIKTNEEILTEISNQKNEIIKTVKKLKNLNFNDELVIKTKNIFDQIFKKIYVMYSITEQLIKENKFNKNNILNETNFEKINFIKDNVMKIKETNITNHIYFNNNSNKTYNEKISILLSEINELTKEINYYKITKELKNLKFEKTFIDEFTKRLDDFSKYMQNFSKINYSIIHFVSKQKNNNSKTNNNLIIKFDEKEINEDEQNNISNIENDNNKNEPIKNLKDNINEFILSMEERKKSLQNIFYYEKSK